MSIKFIIAWKISRYVVKLEFKWEKKDTINKTSQSTSLSPFRER